MEPGQQSQLLENWNDRKREKPEVISLFVPDKSVVREEVFASFIIVRIVTSALSFEHRVNFVVKMNQPGAQFDAQILLKKTNVISLVRRACVLVSPKKRKALGESKCRRLLIG
jgi:hypothetical protein